MGEFGDAITRNRFCTFEKINYRMKFLPTAQWKKDMTQPIVYELCAKCREDLDKWLKGGN